MPLPSALSAMLRHAGQEHLIDHVDQLPASDRSPFLEQLLSVNWELVAQLWRTRDTASAINVRDAQTPRKLIRLPTNEAERSHWQAARVTGEEALRSGRVAVVVVAGGQGTRLGISFPKGLLPVGPLSQHTLFQMFFEQLRARQDRYRITIPYAIMTSHATHTETIQTLQKAHYFGLDPENVWPFCQGRMPAVDAETGEALLAERGQLALNPDGHGGILAAMSREGLLEKMKTRGIDTLFYHQVDNPTTIVADPTFLGWHLQTRAEMSTKVVAKRSAQEKMGVVVDLNGATQIIEYSDLSADLAAATDDQGRLRIWAGNTAIHAFQRDFLERALVDKHALPFHVARKSVPYWTASTGAVVPSAPNAFKFERFIFDVMPWSQSALIVEADRAAEFNPIKNNTGDDSLETSQAAMMSLHRCWLRAAGASVGDEIPVEVSPQVALEATDLHGRIAPGTVLTEPTWLAPETVMQYPWFQQATPS